MLAHLDELRTAGVDSVKVEGRVKGAYYVATIVNAYRQVIDGADPALIASELDTVSHRPYSTGFFYGTPSQSYDGKEYTQTCDFVGGVTSCEQLPDGRYRVRFALRNRIYRDDELEVLSPGKSIRAVRACDLTDEEGEPCAQAAHNAHSYAITCDIPLAPLDILRKRRTNPNIQAGR